MDKLGELNGANDDDAAALLAPVIERAPGIARRVAERRPFANTEALSQAIRTALLALDESERVRIISAHPELAPKNPFAMTQESQTEQGWLSLTSTGNAYRARLDDLNARYRDKFGFPFITALIRHRDTESVLREFEARLMADRASEIEVAIDQIAVVSASRVSTAFGSAVSDESQQSFKNAYASREHGT